MRPDAESASTRLSVPAVPRGPVDPTWRVAVLPFSYKGADAYAYLGEGMVDLLSRTLDGAGPLQIVDPRPVLGVLAQRLKHKDGASGRNLFGVPISTARVA